MTSSTAVDETDAHISKQNRLPDNSSHFWIFILFVLPEYENEVLGLCNRYSWKHLRVLSHFIWIFGCKLLHRWYVTSWSKISNSLHFSSLLWPKQFNTFPFRSRSGLSFWNSLIKFIFFPSLKKFWHCDFSEACPIVSIFRNRLDWWWPGRTKVRRKLRKNIFDISFGLSALS